MPRFGYASAELARMVIYGEMHSIKSMFQQPSAGPNAFAALTCSSFDSLDISSGLMISVQFLYSKILPPTSTIWRKSLQGASSEKRKVDDEKRQG